VLQVDRLGYYRLEGVQLVGYQDCCHVGSVLANILYYDLLALTVDPRCAFIEQQQTRVFDQGTSQRQSLFFSSRQIVALLDDHGIEPSFGLNKLEGVGHFQALPQPLIRVVIVLIAVSEIISEGPFEEINILCDIRDHSLYIFEGEVIDLKAIDENGTHFWFFQFSEDIEQRRFS
jgi:hypothetical protein